MRHADDTLETYLAQIVSGAPVREPEPGIEPILRVAQQLHRVGNVEPSPAAVERIRLALRRAPVRDGATRPTMPHFGLWRRPAMGLVFGVVLLALGTTSALAAPSALPDSPLYSVRNWRESVQVQLAANSAQRAVLYASFAGERTTQLRQLAGHKAVDPGLVTTLLRDITARVQRANQEAHDDGQAAQSAVRGVEGQIGNQLSELKQEGEFSGDAATQLTDTLRAVQSSQSGQSGASSSGTTDNGNGDTNQP
jgi:hypothetical protein